jgi:hypothetical protein
VSTNDLSWGDAVAGLSLFLLIVVLTPVILIAAALWEAVFLNILWGYFVAPTFGMASPGILMLAGLSLFVSLLRYKATQGVTQSTGKVVGGVILGPPLLGFFGWILHLFV